MMLFSLVFFVQLMFAPVTQIIPAIPYAGLTYNVYAITTDTGESAFAPAADEAVNTNALNKTIKDLRPNELGTIPVVMYHNLVDSPDEEGYYARSFDNFKADMIRLHKEGYFPITMKAWVSGIIDVPAGKTPVVLTFDDGHSTDLQLDADGKPTAKCVVGIMEAVQAEYPKFVPAATFYLNGPHAFGDLEYDPRKMEYLLERGYEIANHTTNHENLSEIPLERAKEEILSNAKRLEPYIGKKFSFSVPFGEKFEGFADKIRSAWLGEYEMISSVNVGWNPTNSVFSIDFDALDINRITCGDDDFELAYWLDYLKDNPEERFVSDGLSGYITCPKSAYPAFANDRFSSKDFKLVVYDDESLEILSSEEVDKLEKGAPKAD